MSTTDNYRRSNDGAGDDDTTTPAASDGMAALTSDQIWNALAKTSFAVLGHVTPAGEPRSSGVVYAVVDRRMYVVVADDSWKARHIAVDGHVAVTVPVRRGGILSLIFPIPPATVSFHASAIVYPAGEQRDHPLPAQLAAPIPPERRGTGRIIEIQPEGEFLTYGVGVSLNQMRSPARARRRVPVG
jgi:hypothetical protein